MRNAVIGIAVTIINIFIGNWVSDPPWIAVFVECSAFFIPPLADCAMCFVRFIIIRTERDGGKRIYAKLPSLVGRLIEGRLFELPDRWKDCFEMIILLAEQFENILFLFHRRLSCFPKSSRTTPDIDGGGKQDTSSDASGVAPMKRHLTLPMSAEVLRGKSVCSIS